MMREKSSCSFLRSLVKDQDHSFFKDLAGVFCTVAGTLVPTYLPIGQNVESERGNKQYFNLGLI
jgi:hypothetical protein